jgi:hypothetical protein
MSMISRLESESDEESDAMAGCCMGCDSTASTETVGNVSRGWTVAVLAVVEIASRNEGGG